MACSAWLRSAGTGLTGAAGGGVGGVVAGAGLMGGGVAAGGATAAGPGVGRPGAGTSVPARVAAGVSPAPGEGRAEAPPVEGRTTVTSSSITGDGAAATGEATRGEACATWPPAPGGLGRRPRNHHARPTVVRTATATTMRPIERRRPPPAGRAGATPGWLGVAGRDAAGSDGRVGTSS